MKAKYKRLSFLTLLLLSFFFGCTILFINLKDNLIYFFSPTEFLTKEIKINKKIRLGGMVQKSSLNREIINEQGKKIEEISFVITDYQNSMPIEYKGILPDLFKEEQGVIVEGFFKNKEKFVAQKILAKHDENYMPPEIKDNLIKVKGVE
tara:strand:+ start:4793 stop:5242 length:450 start_codon:yes stop_codon:yes gene_type:complete